MPNVVGADSASVSDATSESQSGSALWRIAGALGNPLGSLLRGNPALVALGFSVAGLVAVALSYLIGIAWTTATVQFTFPDGTVSQPRTVWLGYLNHLHYGLWYAIAFPIVLALVGLIVVLIERHTPPALRQSLSWRSLSQLPSIALIGGALFYGALAKNLWVERNDHKTLGLGWVQSLALSEVAKTTSSRGSYQLTDRRFLPVDELGTVRSTTGAVVLSVSPSDLTVRSELGLIALVVLAKTLAATWEALLTYVGVLALVWGTRIVSGVTPDSLEAVGENYVVRWARRPMFYLFVVGLSAELFTILRMCINLQKGSFGKWDQLVGMGIHLPGIVATGIAVSLFVRIHVADVKLRDDDNIFSWQVFSVLTMWVSGGALLGRQFLYYFSPGSHELLVLLAALVGVKLG